MNAWTRPGVLLATAAFAALLLAPWPAAASQDGNDGCVRLAWREGDVSGFTSILDEEGRHTLGFVEYRQRMRGDTMEISRVAHFVDGSSEEDRVEASVGEYLRALRGRTVMRDAAGRTTLDVAVDVGAGTIRGFSGVGHHRENYDEDGVEIHPCTYWGPLLGIVLKNFLSNARDGVLEVRTIVVTPTPRQIGLEFEDQGPTRIERVGGELDVEKVSMVAKVNFLLNPLLRYFGPETTFYVRPGEPPSMARFVGPRNYRGQIIRIE